jgi:hypothetical protein
MADQAIMQMYRKDVIGVQAIGRVLKAYEEPPHDWGSKTAWRLEYPRVPTLLGPPPMVVVRRCSYSAVVARTG